jgi:hypothetical protein
VGLYRHCRRRAGQRRLAAGRGLAAQVACQTDPRTGETGQAAAEGVRASVYLTVAQTMIAIDQLLVDRPKIRAELYGAVPDDDANLSRQQAEAAAEMLADMFDMVMANGRHISAPVNDGWRAYMTDVIADSLTMRKFWRENRHWYDPSLQEILDPPTQSSTDWPSFRQWSG